MRALAFPVCTVAVLASTACGGLSINDPMVRACHTDTTVYDVRFPDGTTTADTMFVAFPWQHCRKAG